jgi:hypothetical protein
MNPKPIFKYLYNSEEIPDCDFSLKEKNIIIEFLKKK